MKTYNDLVISITMYYSHELMVVHVIISLNIEPVSLGQYWIWYKRLLVPAVYTVIYRTVQLNVPGL